MTRKRTWTVPILLLVITGLMILLVLTYSRLLVTQLENKKEEGRLLADQYQAALKFSERLAEGANLLLQIDQADHIWRAHLLWGEAKGLSGQTTQLLAEAVSRSSAQPLGEAAQQLQAAMETLTDEDDGWLLQFTARADSLGAADDEALRLVLAGAEAMHAQLKQFRPPTLDAGFRQMAAGVDWVEPAATAGRQLQDLASRLGK